MAVTGMTTGADVAARWLSRRRFLGSAAALATAALSGCARDAEPRPLAMTVHRDPSCGCCAEWARQAGVAGFSASVVDEPDMTAVKRRLGVPEDLASCHTAVCNRFVIEGHVPFDQVHRLIGEHPAGVIGLAVPGMPAGSPGMEMPDGRREPFQVFAFDAQGRTTLFHEVSA